MKRISVLAVIFLLISVQPVAAYLDPGAGSYMWQILVGSLLGILFMVKSYGTLFKAKLQQLTKKESGDEKQESKSKTISD